MGHEKLDRVIFVDDSEDEAFLTRILFEQQAIAMELVHVTDMDELEDCCRKMPEALDKAIVAVDLNMPKMHGSDVVQQLKSDKRFENVVVGVFTGSDDPADKIQALEAGADFFVSKPLEKKTLSLICEQVNHLSMDGGAIVKL